VETGGVPLELVFVRREAEQAGVDFLVDISGSLAPLWPFVRTVIGTLEQLGIDVNVYLFCSHIFPPDEIPPEEFHGVTDLKNAFEEYYEQRRAVLPRRAVVIFSDFRQSEGGYPGEVLQEIKKRAAKLVLLDPDPYPGEGDSLHYELEEELGMEIYSTLTMEDLVKALEDEILKKGIRRR